MQLFLIRHAQSQNNAFPESERVEDPPITTLGHEQAHCLGQWIPRLDLSVLVTSPFLRALETTEYIRKATNLVPSIEVDLHEQGGCYTGHTMETLEGRPGMNRTELAERFPGYSIASEIDDMGWWKGRPHESHPDAVARADTLLQRTITQFGGTNERIAYVMHGDLKMRLLELFHPSALELPWNTSITKLRIVDGQVALEAYNLIEHLPPALATI